MLCALPRVSIILPQFHSPIVVNMMQLRVMCPAPCKYNSSAIPQFYRCGYVFMNECVYVMRIFSRIHGCIAVLSFGVCTDESDTLPVL